MMILIIKTRIQITQSSLLFLFLMKNNHSKMKTTHLQIPIKYRIYHPQLISKQNHSTNTPHFHTNKKKQKTNNTNPENQSAIHDYDNYINPQRHTYDRYNFRPQPRKDYRLFLGEKDILSFSQNPAERKLKINSNTY